MVDMATSLGFDVQEGDLEVSTDVSQFALGAHAEDRGRGKGNRGHLPSPADSDPMWSAVLACHASNCGIFVSLLYVVLQSCIDTVEVRPGRKTRNSLARSIHSLVAQLELGLFEFLINKSARSSSIN
jgi:hypothetical protein